MREVEGQGTVPAVVHHTFYLATADDVEQFDSAAGNTFREFKLHYDKVSGIH